CPNGGAIWFASARGNSVSRPVHTIQRQTAGAQGSSRWLEGWCGDGRLLQLVLGSPAPPALPGHHPAHGSGGAVTPGGVAPPSPRCRPAAGRDRTRSTPPGPRRRSAVRQPPPGAETARETVTPEPPWRGGGPPPARPAPGPPP